MATVRLVSVLVLRVGGRLPALPRAVARAMAGPVAVLLGTIVNVNPASGTAPGAGAVQRIANGIAWWALLLSLLGLVIGAASWAIGSHSSNYQYTSAGKRAVVVSGLAAMLIGAAPYLVNFFFTTGQSVH